MSLESTPPQSSDSTYFTFSCKKRYVFIAIFVVFFVWFFLYVRYFMPTRGEEDSRHCLLRQPTKCAIRMTDAELLREIFVYGDLSKHEAKKLFLEAQQKNEQYVRLYSEKENPTEDNLRAIKGSTEVNQYFERVQQLLNGRLSKN